MKPIHRGVVGLTEPGAATSAMVALTASQRAVAHYVSSGTIGIGTGRFGIRGTHLEPLADLTCPHILQESLPGVVHPCQILPIMQSSLQSNQLSTTTVVYKPKTKGWAQLSLELLFTKVVDGALSEIQAGGNTHLMLHYANLR